ncbi:MAG: ABC transporter ATP-binding protein [Bacteroidota bacterium]
MAEKKIDDQQLYKSVDFSLLKRLFVFLKPYQTPVLFAVALTLVSSALAPARPYLTKIAVDTFIVKQDKQGLLFYIILIFGLLIVQGAVQYGLTYLMQWAGQKVLYDVRMKLFNHIQKLSLRFYDTTPIGRLVTRVTNDVEVLNELFSSGVVMIVADVMLIVWIVIFMLMTSWKLTIATVIVLPLLFFATSIFRKKVRAAYSGIRTQVARMNSFLNEHISGITTVQLFSQESRQYKTFDRINREHTDIQIKSIFYYALFFPTVEMLSAIALAIILWYTARGIFSGEMTIGILIAFTQYTEMFFRPIRDLTEKYNTLQSAMASSERVFDLLDTTSFVEDAPGAVALPKLENSIEFKNVSFSYDGETPVLKDVSFTVNKGETVAIVGPTGSGKSSIINLLCRFYEFQSGDILIDGKSIRTIQQKSLRTRIALVLQDIFLFSRTIGENISLKREDISDEDVRKAAAALGLAEFIERLPNKYDTAVMERGATLSVGQKQLISFSRALATDPDILILDEATSSIDTETEQLIERSISTLLKGRTSIVIAHRLSTIQRADKIIVLYHGEIREMGTHQELLAKSGLYAKLYRLQYKEQFNSSVQL